MILFDIKKAFDSVCRPLLWDVLKTNAKTPEERHIVELIIQLHSEHKIYVDDHTSFTANKGLLQGTKLGPKLFNVYMHHCLSQIPALKMAIEKKSLLSFADDMIFRTNSLDSAKAVISGMEQLKRFGLEINKEKSLIRLGPTLIKDMTKLCVIPIQTKVKYLGYTFCSRKDDLIR